MLLRKAQLALKLETTEGTAVTVAAADADLYVYDVSFSPDIQTTPRNPLRATLSPLAHFIGRKQAQISFKTELVGSGTAGTPPLFGDALKACGMSVVNDPGTSDIYSPDSDVVEGDGTSATLAVYLDGKRFMIYGARGDFEFGFAAGEPAFITFTFTGVYGGVTDAALLSGITYSAIVPKVFLGATLTNGGDDLTAENVTIAANNTVAMRPDVSNASGFIAAAISERSFGGSMDPEEVLEATRADWTQFAAGSTTAFQLVHGNVAGNILTIDAPDLVIESLGHGEREGVLTNALDFKLTSDTAGGDDEVTFTFT